MEQIAFIIVVLPAPFGPKSPVIELGSTVKEILSEAILSLPYFFVNEFNLIIY